ncbi:hypothetical protein ACN47E_001914 [Coniothyrium glycines]
MSQIRDTTTVATAVYFAAHFNMPKIHHEPTILKLRAPTLPQDVNHFTPSHNIYIHAAQHLAKYGHTNYQEASPFFRLPAELRNQIYTSLLCPDAPHAATLHAYKSKGPRQPVYPAILASCRRIHSEAGAMLYENIFSAHPALLTQSPHLASSARPLRSASAIDRVKRWQLIIRLDTDTRFGQEDATNAFSGAEYLDIKLRQSMYDGVDAGALRLFTGVRGVGVARVSGCCDGELARWLEESMMQPVAEEKEVDEEDGPTGSQPSREWFGAGDAWTFGNR